MIKGNRNVSSHRNIFRDLAEIIIEKVTFRKCSKCKHNRGIICMSPKYEECVSRLFPVSFEKK
jgi:hypothetical protein